MSNPFAADWNKPSAPKARPGHDPSAVDVSLIAMLDPDRDYGSRTFEQVVLGLKAGELIASRPDVAGHPPILRTSAGALIKGTGPYFTGGGSPQNALQSQLIAWADHGGLEAAANRLNNIIRHGEPAVAVKAIDVLLKYTMPKAREAAPDDSIAVKLLEALMTTREARPITIYEVNQ